MIWQTKEPEENDGNNNFRNMFVISYSIPSWLENWDYIFGARFRNEKANMFLVR